MLRLLALFGFLFSLFTLPAPGDGDDDLALPGDSDDDDTDLGDAGKKALAQERANVKAARREAKAAKAAQAAAERALAAAQEAGASAEEKAIAAARKEGEAATEEKFAARIIASEVRIAAAKAGLATPGDAVALIDMSDLDIDDEAFAATVEAKIAELVEERPYLKGPAKKVEGDADGGAKPAGDGILTDDKLTPQQRLRRAYST